MPTVRLATPDDTKAIAAVHRGTFVRQRDSETWVAATLAAMPRLVTYVLEEDPIIGYIVWAQKSGIRSAAVLELDQVAIQRPWREKGLGPKLIRASLKHLAARLADNDQQVKAILVSTRSDNAAQRIYSSVLGARVVAEIEDLYSATEVLMLASRHEIERAGSLSSL